MIILVGLVILVAAVAGVAGNGGSAHAQPLTGARLPRDQLRRPLFPYGIVAVAIDLLGLSLLLASARRTARRGALRAAGRGSPAARPLSLPTTAMTSWASATAGRPAAAACSPKAGVTR